MKNKMVDVRNHLCAMLEELGDKECTPATIERAKATGLLANAFVSAVKTEIDALRLADDIGRLPASVAPSDILPAPATEAPFVGKPRLVGHG